MLTAAPFVTICNQVNNLLQGVGYKYIYNIESKSKISKYKYFRIYYLYIVGGRHLPTPYTTHSVKELI